MAKLRITWKKSGIGKPEVQKRTVRALGLRKLNHTVEHNDTPIRRLRSRCISISAGKLDNCWFYERVEINGFMVGE